MISEKDIELAEFALARAGKEGAEKCRVTLVRSTEDLVATLDGEIDRITRCEDSSISLSLIANGRYGTFSTNKLDKDSLGEFITRAISVARMMAPDPCRCLPEPSRYCTTAITGNEMELLDPEYLNVTPEMRNRFAKEASVFGTDTRIISEEGEYSDSIYETLIMDSEGLKCIHCENSFDYGVEITIEVNGDKYSGYDWDSSPRLSGLNSPECGKRALQKALDQVGADSIKGGKYNMVIDSERASKVVSPILNALSAYAIQQNDSFLADSLDKQVFPEGLTIMDLPHIKGQSGSKLFDSEGVATKECPIIEKGIVKEYFVNSYMSRKMGISPTIDEASRPKVMPWPKPGLTRTDILRICGDGILVTDFNGGNSNQSTGDFSYGIEGFLFKNGKIIKPVSGMLVTGNFLKLWKSLIAAGDDARSCMSKLIPTLAFSKVDFNG